MKRRISYILLIVNICLLIVNYRRLASKFHFSPEEVLEEHLRVNSRTCIHKMEQKRENYVEYFCEVDDGILLVAVMKNKLYWSLYSAQHLAIDASSEKEDVYYLSRYNFKHKDTNIYGICRKNGTYKVKAMDSDYDVDHNLFCVRVPGSVSGNVKLCGVDRNDKTLWDMNCNFDQ